MVKLELLRGHQTISVTVEVTDGDSDVGDPTDALDANNSVISRLGIACVSFPSRPHAAGSDPRSEAGIRVAAKLAHTDARTGLAVGDLIRSLNSTKVGTVDELRTRVENFKSGDPVVVQVERHGRLKFVAFEID